jgi:hypothetical protein
LSLSRIRERHRCPGLPASQSYAVHAIKIVLGHEGLCRQGTRRRIEPENYNPPEASPALMPVFSDERTVLLPAKPASMWPLRMIPPSAGGSCQTIPSLFSHQPIWAEAGIFCSCGTTR